MLALIDVRKEAFVGIMYVYFAIYLLAHAQ